VPRRGWREEDGIYGCLTTIAGARNAGISACRAPGRLGRRMLQIWSVRSTSIVGTMNVPGIRLESVRRKSGGRIHLTPRVPKGGPVTTLCGQTLGAGTYAAVEAAADCANCIRRSRDASRISSAFFEQEEGSELLRLSLEQARFRKPAPRQATPPAKPVSRPSVVPSPAIQERIGELVTAGFKAAGDGVWRSPGGVVVRMAGKSRDRFSEVVFEGSVLARKLDDGMRLRAGDVEVMFADGNVEIRVKRS
jgi:hypothetical protein